MFQKRRLADGFLRTSVIRYPNGTFSHVSLLEAEQAYKSWMLAMMPSSNDGAMSRQPPERLSDKPTAHVLQSSRFADMTATDLAGKSIDESINPLVSLLSALRFSTESQLGYKISYVSISVPLFLDFSILQPALTTVGLQALSSWPDNTPAVMASLAHGIGVCACPQYWSGCAMAPIRPSMVLSIDYSSSAIAVRLFESLLGWPSAWLDGGLTFDQEAPSPNASKSQTRRFWQTLTSTLRGLFAAIPSHRRLDHLVLTGTQANDSMLHNAIRQSRESSSHLSSYGEQFALAPDTLLSSAIEKGVMIDPVFAAARGAAELGWRHQMTMMPCLDPCSRLDELPPCIEVGDAEKRLAGESLWSSYIEHVDYDEEETEP